MQTELKISASCPDAELSAAVGVNVAGLYVAKDYRTAWKKEPLTLPDSLLLGFPLPPFATSADAVLPLLENQYKAEVCYLGPRFIEHERGEQWRVEIWCEPERFAATATSLARAACLALLQAHNFTVLDAAGNGRAK